MSITEFLAACETGNLEKVNELLCDQTIDPAQNDNELVRTAVMWCQVDILDALLRNERVKKATTPEFLFNIAKGNGDIETYLKNNVYKLLSFCNECPICLETTADMFTMSCLHCVHLECVEGMNKKECPICRKEVTNWPEAVSDKILQNGKEYKDEVFREEQDAIRQELGNISNGIIPGGFVGGFFTLPSVFTLPVMTEPHPVLNLPENSFMFGSADFFRFIAQRNDYEFEHMNAEEEPDLASADGVEESDADMAMRLQIEEVSMLNFF